MLWFFCYHFSIKKYAEENNTYRFKWKQKFPDYSIKLKTTFIVKD